MSDQNLCIGSKIEECKIENKQESCLQASSIAEREMSNDSLARVFLMHGCDLNSGRACDLLATRINRQTGDTAQAMAIAKKACDLGMEIGCLNAACYASLLQKNEEALDFLKQSVNLGYNNWSWIHKDDDLIGLRATAGFIEFDQKFNPSFTSK